MSIKINRFSTENVKRNVQDTPVTIKNSTAILIKDHTDDNIISLIQLENDVKKNTELAERIITTIEDWIVENDNSD